MSDAPTLEPIFERIRPHLIERLRLDAEPKKLELLNTKGLDTSFEDLEADSLDMVESVMALEQEFAISIDEDELDGLDTLRKVAELVRSKLS